MVSRQDTDGLDDRLMLKNLRFVGGTDNIAILELKPPSLPHLVFLGYNLNGVIFHHFTRIVMLLLAISRRRRPVSGLSACSCVCKHDTLQTEFHQIYNFYALGNKDELRV